MQHDKITRLTHLRCLPHNMIENGEGLSDVKISIKPRAAVNTPAAETVDEDCSSKVSVRVRRPSELSSNYVEDQSIPLGSRTSIKFDNPTSRRGPPEIALSSAEQLLLNATQAANCSLILEALKAGANPNILDPKGRTPLHFLAGVGLAPAIVLLIHFGAQIDVQDSDGLTPLHMAAGYANAKSLRILIAAGANVSIAGKEQGAPVDVVKQLGEYQWELVYGSKKKKELFKPRKDDKLQKLKECLTALMHPETVRAEHDWDELVLGTLRLLSVH